MHEDKEMEDDEYSHRWVQKQHQGIQDDLISHSIIEDNKKLKKKSFSKNLIDENSRIKDKSLTYSTQYVNNHFSRLNLTTNR